MKSLIEILIPKSKKKRRRRTVFLVFILILIGVRIWLPYFLKDRLVAAVNEVEGYECTLGDLDLALFRGAMVLQDFEIKITENAVTKPFVYCKNADISVEWRAIFYGSSVSEVILEIGRAHVCTPVTSASRMPSSA